MSSTRQTVVRGPSFVGCGNRPDLTPAHQVDLLTGIGPRGARMPESRTNPVWGRPGCSDMVRLHSMANGGVVDGATRLVAEYGYALPVYGFALQRLIQSPGRRSLAALRWSRTLSSEYDKPKSPKSIEIAVVAVLRILLGS